MPLALWLSGDTRTLSFTETHPSPQDDRLRAGCNCNTDEFEVLLALELEQAREEFRQEAAVSVASMKAEEQRKSNEREATIAAEWSTRCAEATGNALASLLEDLQERIGKALNDVLQPLLPGVLRERAIAKFFELLDQEFEAVGNELLEVRAPLEMHAKLRLTLDQLGIQAVLTESKAVETLSRNGNGRFESLADTWAGLVLSGEA